MNKTEREEMRLKEFYDSGLVVKMNISGGGNIFVEGSRNCKDCGYPFMMEAKEVRFFFEHDLFLTRRCPACRVARKSEKKIEAQLAVEE